MWYSNEIIKKCVDLYMQGKYLNLPNNISFEIFHKYVRLWVRVVENCSFYAINHKSHTKQWAPNE